MAKIRWARTKAGKHLPLDAATTRIAVLDEAGNVASITAGHVPHWATCPTADEHRREQR